MLIDIKDLYKIYNEGQESEVRALDGVGNVNSKCEKNIKIF